MIIIFDKNVSAFIYNDSRGPTIYYSSLQIALARFGIDSIFFDNSIIAVEHYQRNHGRYALVLLDLTLPMMNGLEFAKRIRTINSKIHILLITGYHVKDIVHDDEFREAKISEILLKPIRFEDIGPRIIKLY